MTTYPNLSIVLPTRGAPGSGHWADTLDADLALIDGHDHKSGKGLAINSAALAIDGDVSFGSAWAVTALQRVTFASVTALAANNKSLFVSSADNELYWRSNAGNNVKLTSGSALNVAAFTGGIGGDYTSVSAALNYDSSGTRYTLKGASGTNWARMASGEVRIFETGTAETVFVGHAAPAALASSYTVTWPLAAPASKSFVLMDSAGTLTVTSAGADHSHNMNFAVLSGGAATKVVGSSAADSASRIALGTDVGVQILPLIIPIGTLTGYSVTISKSSAAGTISVKLLEGAPDNVNGTVAQIGSTQSNSANNPGNISLAQTGLTFAMTAGREYWMELSGGGTTGDIVYGYSAAVAVLP